MHANEISIMGTKTHFEKIRPIGVLSMKLYENHFGCTNHFEFVHVLKVAWVCWLFFSLFFRLFFTFNRTKIPRGFFHWASIVNRHETVSDMCGIQIHTYTLLFRSFPSGISECPFPCPAVCITCSIWLSLTLCVLLVLTSPRLASCYPTMEFHRPLSRLWQTRLWHHLMPLPIETRAWQVYITGNGAFMTFWSTTGLSNRERRAINGS